MLARNLSMHLELDLVLPESRQASKWLEEPNNQPACVIKRKSPCSTAQKGPSNYRKLVLSVGLALTTSDMQSHGEHGHTYKVLPIVAHIDTDSV